LVALVIVKVEEEKKSFPGMQRNYIIVTEEN